MERKGGGRRQSTKKQEAFTGRKWQRTAAFGVAALHLVALARRVCKGHSAPFLTMTPVSFPAQCILALCLALICTIREGPRQQVSIEQVGLIAATAQWPPAPAVGRVETGKGHGENEHRMTCR